jgi:hypothetical protein
MEGLYGEPRRRRGLSVRELYLLMFAAQGEY